MGFTLDESHFRSLAEAAPDAIVTGDATGHIAYANPAAERLFGYPSAELVGRPIAVLVPERLRAAHTAGLERFVRTGRGRLVGTTLTVPALCSDGRELPVELSLGSSGEGAERTLTAVIRDLSDRRRRDRQLAAQLAVTEVLAGASTLAEAGPLIVERLTAALEWDVGTLWLVSDEHELALRHVWQLDPERTRRFIEATESPAYDVTIGLPAVMLADGHPAWHDDLSVVPGFQRREAALACGLRSGVCLPLATEGRSFGAIECFTREYMPLDTQLRELLGTIASQVSEHLRRREAQEALERAKADLERSNADLEDFAHIVAHDLQGPLRTMAGFAELLLRRGDELAREDARSYLEAIGENATAASRLLNSLLAYARVGRAEPVLEPIDTRELVAGVLIALHADLKARRAEVRIVSDLPEVLADPAGLRQVFQNLIANAVRYTPAERAPRVEISARADAETVELRVADEGVGVSAQDVPRLFAMYRRGSAATGRAPASAWRSARGRSSATAAGSGSSRGRAAAAPSASRSRAPAPSRRMGRRPHGDLPAALREGGAGRPTSVFAVLSRPRPGGCDAIAPRWHRFCPRQPDLDEPRATPRQPTCLRVLPWCKPNASSSGLSGADAQFPMSSTRRTAGSGASSSRQRPSATSWPR